MSTLANMEPKPASSPARHTSPTSGPTISKPAGLSGSHPITVSTPEVPLTDVMHGASRHEIRIPQGGGAGGGGFIALIDCMPRLIPEGQTADSAIVQAARVSYGQGTKKVNEDRGLIRYLLRHRHTTPFEMLEFKFHIAMPIFVARQWIRHRTANVNEYSGRYSIMPDQFYRPTVEEVRKQSAANRQGGEETFAPTEEQELKTAQAFVDYLAESEALYEKYKSLTEQGVSREMARIGLPVSVYTQWYWKCDLHNILRFLSLRMDAHAQAEIRWYAEAMYALLEPIVPITLEAWRDYELEAVRLTRLEIEAVRTGADVLSTDNKREQAEWESKRAELGM